MSEWEAELPLDVVLALGEWNASGRPNSGPAHRWLVQQGINPFDFDRSDIVEEVESRQKGWLRKRFGRDVGLNADWSTSAWIIDKARGLVLLDNEDGSYSAVQCEDDICEDEAEEVGYFNDFAAVKRTFGSR